MDNGSEPGSHSPLRWDFNITTVTTIVVDRSRA